MNNPRPFGALALLACTALTACAPAVRPEARSVEQDERAVMVALIRHLERESGGRKPVVEWMTRNPDLDALVPSVEAFQQREDDEERPYLVPGEAFEDLVARNEEPAPVWRLIGDSTRVRWLTPAQRDSLLAAADAPETRLQAIHPGARYFVAFSRAGFDPWRRYAAIAYDTWCGELCGSGGVVLLYRRYDRWEVVEQFPMLAATPREPEQSAAPAPGPVGGTR